MEVEKFSFRFKYGSKMLVANCSKFQVVKKPQVRVCIDLNEKYPWILTYYVMEDGLFWFPLKKHKQEFAELVSKKIAAKLK